MNFLVSEAAEPSSNIHVLEAELVLDLIGLVILIVLLVWDLKLISDSRKLAKGMGLPKGQWLRLVKTLPFDPVVELLVVGIVLYKDIVQNWQHVLAAVLGAAIGIVVGRYRYRIQYVRAVPEYKAIVFVRSREEYIALTILILVRFAAEQHRIPIVGPLTLLITFLLALIVVESISRSTFAYRRYKHDCAELAGAAASQ